MICKVTFHISTLYIYQISSTQELPTLQDMKKGKEEKLIHVCILYARNFLHENGYQILHNWEYQSR